MLGAFFWEDLVFQGKHLLFSRGLTYPEGVGGTLGVWFLDRGLVWLIRMVESTLRVCFKGKPSRGRWLLRVPCSPPKDKAGHWGKNTRLGNQTLNTDHRGASVG